VLESPPSTESFHLIFQLPSLDYSNLSPPNGICRSTLISAATLQRAVPIFISSYPLIPNFFPTITNLGTFFRCRLHPESLPSRKQRQHSILLLAQWGSAFLVWASRVNRQAMYVTPVGMSHELLLTGYFPPCSPNALTCSIPTTLTTPLAMDTEARVRGRCHHAMSSTQKM